MCLFAVVVLGALAPGSAALAAAPVQSLPATPGGGPSSPFTPGVPQPTPTVPTTTTSAPIIAAPQTTTSTGGGLSGGAALAIGIGALVVLGGISFFIWRDARRRAPVRHGAVAAAGGVGGRSGSKRPSKPRKLSPAERRRRKRGRAR